MDRSFHRALKCGLRSVIARSTGDSIVREEGPNVLTNVPGGDVDVGARCGNIDHIPQDRSYST